MSKRQLALCCTILAFAAPNCGPSLRTGFDRLFPVSPEAPRTDAEILLRMALRRAVVDEKAVPDYGLLPDPHKIVLLKSDSVVTARIVPASDSIRFIILSPDEVQEFADRYDHFVYISVGVGPVAGDSAWAGVATRWARSRKRPGIVYLSGGSCAWQYRKRDGTWTFEKTLACIIS